MWRGRLFVRHVCGWQNQGEEQRRSCCWLALFPAQFFYLWFMLDGCQCVWGHRNRHRQPCVNFITHTVVSLKGGKLLCCCLSLWFAFLLSLFLLLSLCLSFWMRTNGDRYSGLNPAARLAEPGPSYHMHPTGFPLFILHCALALILVCKHPVKLPFAYSDTADTRREDHCCFICLQRQPPHPSCCLHPAWHKSK